MTSADNLSLESALTAPVSVVRELARWSLVDDTDIDGSSTLDPVFKVQGSYQIDSDLTGLNATITFQDVDNTAPGTDGIVVTMPRVGGTITKVDAGTTNATSALMFWQSGAATWQNFAFTVTLKDDHNWDIIVDPVGSVSGKVAPLIMRRLTLTRVS